MTTKTTPAAFRFWTYHREGIVRVTVTEDRPVTLLTGGRNDEGYGYTQDEYRLEDGVIIRDVSSWGRDCDGGYDWNTRSYWRPEFGFVPCIEINDRGETVELPEHRPNWKEHADLWETQNYEEFAE